MKIGSTKNSLLIAAALAPLMGGALLVGCDDDDEPTVVPDAGLADVAAGDATVPGDTLAPGDGGGGCQAENVPVNGDITADTLWDCKSYKLKALTHVINNATLTIKAGTKIVADTDVATTRGGLIVSRGSKIIANGTKEAPIVFTSANVVGNRQSGDFSGLALLGRAKINTGTCVGGTGACDQAGAYFERNIEGLPVADPKAIFGGTDDTWNCGELSYVRVEFAGAITSGDNELNGLTLGGCGSATKVNYIQVHRGKDDGVEVFGGTVNISHILVTGDEDDGLDWDYGWRGSAQFVIVHKWPGLASGDPNGFEADNNQANEAAAPRTAPMIYNATLIGTPGHRGMTLRRGVRSQIRNVIAQGFGAYPADVQWVQDVNVPATEWPTHLTVENSFFWMNGAFPTEAVGTAADDDKGFDESAAFMDAARKNQFAIDPGITSVSPTAPNYTPTSAMLAGQAVPPAPLDVTATYAGAVAPNTPSWTTGWTVYYQN